MRYRHIIEGRDAPVYHGTNRLAAVAILQDDRILPSEWVIGGKLIEGVSLTRRIQFAFTFRASDIAFEFDQTSLAHRFRLIPTNFFSTDDTGLNLDSALQRHEAEEFLIGSLHPVSKYLRAVHMRFPIYRQMEDDPHYDALTKHPLLVVRGGNLRASKSRETWQALRRQSVIRS